MPPRFRSHRFGAAPHQFKEREIPRPTVTLEEQRGLIERAAIKLRNPRVSIGRAAAAMGLNLEKALDYFRAEAMHAAAEFAAKGGRPSQEYVGERVSNHLADYDSYLRAQRSGR